MAGWPPGRHRVAKHRLTPQYRPTPRRTPRGLSGYLPKHAKSEKGSYTSTLFGWFK